jgi:integrase
MKNDDMKSMGKSLEVFDKFLKADATKKLYLRLFTDFLKWTRENIDNSLNADDLLQFDEKKLQGMIEDYILHIRKRLSPNSLPSNIAALEHYFAMNDKDIQFKRIRKMIPPPNKKGGNNAWTTKDIQQMIRNSSSNRDRAFIHFLASTGCRIGSLEGLKLRHILPMSDECRSVLIYEGSNEEYWAFLTPEACNAVDEYLEERRRDGEIINSESPVFRSAYQMGSQIVKPMSIAAAKMISLRLAHTVQRNKVGKRYDVMSAHGFRKRFNTILKSNDKANPSLAEKIMGHRGVFALDGAYLKPTVQILFNEFKKHIPELTINDSERKSIRIEELEEKNTEVQNLKEQFEFNNLLVSQFVKMLHSMGVTVEKLDGTMYGEKDFVIPEKYRIEPARIKIDESLAKNKIEIKV